MPNIGPLEIAIVLVIALVIFGPSRLPELGRSAGKGFREFKHSITGKDDDDAPRSRSASTPRWPARREPEPVRIPAVARLQQASFDDSLTVVEHLDELRTRLVVCGAVLVVAVGLCFWQDNLLLEIANAPLPGDREPITFAVTEPFFTTVKLVRPCSRPAS